MSIRPRFAALCLLASIPVLVTTTPAPEIKWAHDVASGFKTAAEEKKPVLFVIMKDNEIACKRMLEGVYTDDAVRARLANFVLLPCSVYDHTVPGSDQCTQFRGITCAEHQAIEREMRQRYQEQDQVVAPQHIVCDATGKLLLRQLWEMKTGAMTTFLDRGFALFLEASGAPAPESRPESQPAGTPAAPAAAPRKSGLAPELEARVTAILKADEEGKVRLTKELVMEATPERREAFLALVARLKSVKDKELVIRAIGYPEFAGTASAVAKLLDDKDAHVRNYAVVTLEEMANPEVNNVLVDLHKRERDAEVKKDVVRALGPCGGSLDEARALLLKEIGSSADNVRAGAAMSLGYFLAGDADVQKALKKRWEKDSNNLKIKTAILWGIALSNDQSQSAFIDELTKDDNNGQVKQLAAAAKARLAGEDPFEGGGGGGGGRRGGGRGGLFRLLGPLFAEDKVVRNRIKDWRAFGGGGR
jgi:hypothetical protein